MNVYAPTNHTVSRYLSSLNDTSFDRSVDEYLVDSRADTLNVNARDVGESYILEVAVPGMSKKDVKISLSDNVLTIVAQRSKAKGFWKRKEFESTVVKRTVALPDDIDRNTINAKCRHGLLVIKVKKVTLQHRRVIPVEFERVGIVSSSQTGWQKLKTKLTSLTSLISKRGRQALGRLRRAPEKF